MAVVRVSLCFGAIINRRDCLLCPRLFPNACTLYTNGTSNKEFEPWGKKEFLRHKDGKLENIKVREGSAGYCRVKNQPDSLTRIEIEPTATGMIVDTLLVSTRCFVQRHRLTRVLAEYPVHVYQHHRVRHHHDRLLNNHRLSTPRNPYPRRREFMKDEPKQAQDSSDYSRPKDPPASADLIFEITGGLLNNSTITVDTHSLIDQQTHDSDLARWEDTVKKYHSRRLPSLADTHPGDDVRLLEYERRRQQEEERMRRHEIEMRRWREEMKRYHMEIKRLQEDSRRYRAG